MAAKLSPEDTWTNMDSVFTGLGVALVVLEVRGIVNQTPDDTISEWTRTVFRVDTRRGRAAWTATWCGFSAWYLGHILNWWK